MNAFLAILQQYFSGALGSFVVVLEHLFLFLFSTFSGWFRFSCSSDFAFLHVFLKLVLIASMSMA